VDNESRNAAGRGDLSINFLAGVEYPKPGGSERKDELESRYLDCYKDHGGFTVVAEAARAFKSTRAMAMYWR